MNEKGLDYYRRMIDELHRLDIIPNATLYHWDLPYELEREGGWLNREIVNWYGEYATLLFRTFGKDIPLWTTINEPIASYVGYGMGIFAPRRKGKSSADKSIIMCYWRMEKEWNVSVRKI